MRRALCVGALVALGCGGGNNEAPEVPRPRGPIVRPVTRQKGEEVPPPLPAHVVAHVEDEAAPIAFARRSDREGLVLVASGGRWRAQRIGAEGAPAGDAVDVGAAPTGTTLATLEPAGAGYVAAWLEPIAQNHAVKLLWLGADGAARGAPVLVTQVAEHVSWVDLHPTEGGGALVLWEIARADRVDVFASAVAAGSPPGAPSPVLRNALGWEAITVPKGAALACVLPADEPAAAGDRLGKVNVVEIDRSGKAGAPAIVSAEPTAHLDVDVALVGGRYVVAWTDERSIDAAVMVAAVDPGGKVVTPPRRATPPSGEQALVRLVGNGGARGLLAWEDLLKAPGDGRLIHLAAVDANGVLGAERATLVFGASGPPDLVLDGDGFAAMTLAAAGRQGVASEDEPVWPTFVRFGADLTVRASEPIRATAFGEEGVPYLTRALSCAGGECWTLASGAGKNAPLAVVRLPVRQSAWKAPAARRSDGALPRAESLVALYDGEHVADVAATALPGDRTLAAWVTYFVEGATGDGKPKKGKDGEEPLAATLAVRPITPSGLGDLSVVSRRAQSIGGVSIATAPGDKAESALAWVARERGEAQVFVTKLGPDGKKLAQKRLTVVSRKKKGPGLVNEPSDVAIAWAGGGDGGDGWIVAWVDTRDGNAEVYAAKIDRNLEKTVPDRRITEAPGDAAEVQIAVRGPTTLLAWSDARGNVEGGDGDIYVTRLETRSLKKLGEETRVFASAPHSRSPVLAHAAQGTVLAWIEESAEPADQKAAAEPGAQGGVRVAFVDDRGNVSGAPIFVAGEQNGPVTSVALACPGARKKCRAVITTAVGESHRMAAFEIEPGAPAGALTSLVTLTGGTTQDVAPTFSSAAGTDLFFADDAIGGSGRVRWMTLAWP